MKQNYSEKNVKVKAILQDFFLLFCCLKNIIIKKSLPKFNILYQQVAQTKIRSSLHPKFLRLMWGGGVS